MPHIKETDRDYYAATPRAVPVKSGVLNFQLTQVVLAYLKKNGLSYDTCNDIVGALDNCKDEFRRLVQHPYEDEKIKENGSVYDVI